MPTPEREALAAERKRFEHWYITHAFDYSRDPVGSRDCSLQWEAWRAALSSQPPAPSWQAIETAPKSGEFLLGVWEGDWSKQRTRFRIYHATGYPHGPSWAMKGSYRTEEGGAYEVAGWTPLPSAPSTEGAAG